MPGVAASLEPLLQSIPFLRGLESLDVARLLGALEALDVPAGTQIVTEGDDADGLYLLDSGEVEVGLATPDGQRGLARLVAPAHFGELGLLLARRTSSVRTVTDAHLWKLPRERFEQLVRDRPGVGLAVATSALELLEKGQRELAGAQLPAPAPPERHPLRLEIPARARPLRWRVVGGALALGVPWLLWQLPAPSGLSGRGWHVLLVVMGAAIGWLFEPVPDFVIALLVPAAWGITGLAPISLSFAGFASSSWILAVGALTLAAAMARSGLLFRIALFLLRTFPATHSGQVLALLFGGLVVTPLVPAGLARVAAAAPLTEELAQSLGYPVKSRGTAGLAFAGLLGYSIFGSIFLTGLVTNFFLVELLPGAERVRFGWLGWLLSGALAGAVLLVGSAIVLLARFRPQGSATPSRELIRRQQAVLGPLSMRERATLGAVAVLLVGMLLQPLIHIDSAWLAVGAIALALAGGLEPTRFRTSIDWGFLILLGVLLGTGGVLHGAGVDTWIAAGLLPVARAFGQPVLLISGIAVFAMACHLVLPSIPARLLLTLALVPAAAQLGLSAWVVGFTIFTATNIWLLPSQSHIFRIARSAATHDIFPGRDALFVGLAMSAVTLVALAASVPYWQAIGVLAR